MEIPPPQKPKRRVRYAGTHPRRFEEKYKEHHPAAYPETIEKVKASGKTPAGMHRPICVSEILDILDPKPGEIALDATFGYGGHSCAILPRLLPGGKLLALDADPLELGRSEERLRELGFTAAQFVARRTNYAGALQFIFEQGLDGVDCVVADLGLSSMQIDDPRRGFTFKFDGPLDMRMNPSRGQSAAQFISRWKVEDWVRVLEENADEPAATHLAEFLFQAQAQTPITTTHGLAKAVRDALARTFSNRAKIEVDKTIRRVFQAVRIAVNDEFGALEAFLRNLPQCLRPGGRAAVLTFHSGEDRRVKQAFREDCRRGLYSRISEEIVRPSAEEVQTNPRAASAKLRWAVRTA